MVKLELYPSIVTESADSLVLLKCLVIDGNPRTLIKVNWFRNGQVFETSFGETASILRMKNITRFDHGNFSCQGFNGFKLPSLTSSSVPLKVECKLILIFVDFINQKLNQCYISFIWLPSFTFIWSILLIIMLYDSQWLIWFLFFNLICFFFEWLIIA